MKIIKYILLFVFILSVTFSCVEVYNPEIDAVETPLVVEGLITNEKGPFVIKVNKAKVFNSMSVTEAVLGAKLSITDNENNTFLLTESNSGNYTLSANFQAVVGNSYTLHIQTTEGDIYQSAPQKLYPPQSIDSIHGFKTNISFLDKKNKVKTVDGYDIRLDLFKSEPVADSLPACRFKPSLMIQYIYIGPGDNYFKWIYYEWIKYGVGEVESLVKSKSGLGSTLVESHPLAVISFDPMRYDINPEVSGLSYYLTIQQYTINNDTYLFYQGINKQITASGKMFDPISAQLKGNIKCINNPQKKVMGLFEVSSVSKWAYITSPGHNNQMALRKVPYLNISSGSTRYKICSPPPFSTYVCPNPEIDTDYKNTQPWWWYHE